MTEEFVNGYHQIRLDSGVVVSRAGEGNHCLHPFLAGNQLFYTTMGRDNLMVCRNILTGAEIVYDLRQVCADPVYQANADCVVIAFDTFQGLITFTPQDVVAMVFSFAANGFVTAQQQYRHETNFEKLFFVKNGSLDAPPVRLPGNIVNIRFSTRLEIEWSEREQDTQNRPIRYELCRRLLNLDGSMGPLQSIALADVTDHSAEVPSWL